MLGWSWGQSNVGAPWVLRAVLSFQEGSLASWDLVVSVHPPGRAFLGWGVDPCTQLPSGMGILLTLLCLPPAGKPPKTYGGALGALGFRGERCC